MKKVYLFAVLCLLILIFVSCSKKEDMTMKNDKLQVVEERLKAYSPTHIKVNVSYLNDRQKILIQKLCDAGHIADKIFWKQTSPDAIAVRDSLKKLNTKESKTFLDYVMINYGPYDAIYDGERFVGTGAAKKPDAANFYPLDMTKEEFEKYIVEHPDQKSELESQYTIIVRNGNELKAVPYHEAYPEVAELASKLEEAAQYCDNQYLKNYLLLRAKALRTDDYFESDMAWMDLKNNDVDIIIGPIENYEDGLFNYKTAFEAVVMVKDVEASKELDMFSSLIDEFEHRLPYDKKYIRKSAGGTNNVLQIVNVAYFGGDCQSGIKTIASSLPNDPKVHELKGGKKTMFKNMMEAKFDKIVMPIAREIIDTALLPFVDKKAFTSFVTLHEVSHTLGPQYVFGKPELDVRKSLKEKFSAIEETKADILGMYNHKHLFDLKKYDDNYIKKAIVTYLAGLYRSIRFGAEAHGQSNLIQLNYLLKTGAIIKQPNGKLTVDFNIFFDKVEELARMILLIEAEGNYDAAADILNKYGKLTPELQSELDLLRNIPRDLNTTYDY